MKRRFVFPVALALLVAFPVLAQHGGGRGQNPPRANQGRVPPPPPKRDDPRSDPEPEHHDAGRMNSTPHVNNDHWYGHDRPDDKRYHFDHPFEHGRFEHFGPPYRYPTHRSVRTHTPFPLPRRFFFEVAEWDWPICADCCWDCSDDFAFYEDTDHAG